MTSFCSALKLHSKIVATVLATMILPLRSAHALDTPTKQSSQVDHPTQMVMAPSDKDPITTVDPIAHGNVTVFCRQGCKAVNDGLDGSRLGFKLNVRHPHSVPVEAVAEFGTDIALDPVHGQSAKPVLRRLVISSETVYGRFTLGADYTAVFNTLALGSPRTSTVFEPLSVPDIRSVAANFERRFSDWKGTLAIGFDGGGGLFNSFHELFKVGHFGAVDASVSFDPKFDPKDPEKGAHYAVAARRTTSNDLSVSLAGSEPVSRNFRLGFVLGAKMPAESPRASRERSARVMGTWKWRSHELVMSADAVEGPTKEQAGIAAAYAMWFGHVAPFIGAGISSSVANGTLVSPFPTFALGLHASTRN